MNTKIEEYYKILPNYYHSEGSIYQIKQRLKDFNYFIKNKNVEEITVEDINAYLLFLDKRIIKQNRLRSDEEKGVSHRTKTTFLSFLRQLALHAKCFEMAQEISTISKRCKAKTYRLPVSISATETSKLINAAEELGETEKDRTGNRYLILFLLDTGMRRSELAHFKPIELKFGELHNAWMATTDKNAFYNEISKFAIIGKGNRERNIYFHNSLLLSYYENYVKKYKKDTNCLFDHFFPKKKVWGPHNEKTIYLLVQKASRLAKIFRHGKPISPHKLRSTYITEFTKKAGIEKAQEAAGHTNIMTTRLYVVPSPPKKEELPNLVKDFLKIEIS